MMLQPCLAKAQTIITSSYFGNKLISVNWWNRSDLFWVTVSSNLLSENDHHFKAKNANPGEDTSMGYSTLKFSIQEIGSYENCNTVPRLRSSDVVFRRLGTIQVYFARNAMEILDWFDKRKLPNRLIMINYRLISIGSVICFRFWKNTASVVQWLPIF
jgi:hypothetical protein